MQSAGLVCTPEIHSRYALDGWRGLAVAQQNPEEGVTENKEKKRGKKDDFFPPRSVK
jgi:hypothetical protein